METTPGEIIKALRQRLVEEASPLCIDGKPIHWMAKVNPGGFIIRDSAYYSTGFQFCIEEDKFKEILPHQDKVNEVLKICRQWLDSVVPEGKDWALEVIW